MSMSGDVSHDVNPSLSSAVSSEVITAHTFPGSITKKNNKVKAKVERTLKNISSTLSPLRRKKKQYSPKVAKHGVAASSGKDGDTTVKAAITALNPSQSIDVHTTITIPCASPEDDMQFPPINFREAFQNQPRSRPINFREAFQNQPRSRLCQHVWGSIGDTDMRLKMAMVQMRSNVAKERMLARDNLLLCLSARERQCGAHCLESLAVYLKLIALLSPGHPDDGSFDKDDCRSRPLELLGFVESAMMVIQHNPGRTSAADRAELFVRQAQIHLELGHAGKAYDALRGHAVDLHRVLNLEKQKHQINPNENTTTEIIQISSLLIDIARSYLEHDQSHGAKSVVQEALGLGERNFLMLEDEAELLFLLGLLKEMEGDNESAKETYASALETRRTANAGPSKEGSLSYTSLATIMCHYGSIQSKLGEYESACESLQAASIMVADQICDQLNTAAKICSVPTTHDLLQTLNEIAGDVESICHYMNKKNAVTHLGNFYEKLLCCVSATATMKSSCSSSRVTSLRMHIFAGFMTSCVMHGRDLLKNRTPDMAILLCQKPIQMMKCDDALYDACSENFGCIELLKELGAVASEAGEFGDAEYCFAEALNFIMWSLLGPSAGDSGLSRQQLLENCFEKIQRQKLSSCPSALPGQISLDNFLDTLIKMGNANLSRGKTNKASQCFTAAIGFMDQSTGYDGELSSAAKYGQSRVFRTLDKLDASQNLLEEVIAEQKRHGKGCDVGTSYVLNEIGNLLLRRGLNEEASLRYRESIEIKEKILGPMHLDVLGSKRNEALVQAKMGKVDFATTFIEINVLMPQRQHPPTADRDIEVAKTMELLVQLYRRQGVYQKALQSCQEVLRLREKGAGLHDESILVTRMTLCRLLIATGDIESAKRQYEEVSQLVEKLQLTREHALTRQLGKVVTLIEEAAQKKEGQSEKKNAWFFPFSRNKIVASQ